MTHKPRPGVLHITTFLQGGAGRAIVDLALGQQASGRRVAVATSRTAVAGFENYPEYVSRLEDAGVPVIQADSAFSRDLTHNLAMVHAIRESLDGEAIGVVHAHAATPALVGLLLAGVSGRCVPVVQTMHGWGVNKTAEQGVRDLAIMALVERVIVTSHASGADLARRGLAPGKLVSIPCGIDATAPSGPVPETFAPVTRARVAGAAVIACIGSITANKNQRLLIEALPRVSFKPVVVVFVGEGPDTAELQARAGELGVGDRVFFLGYQPQAATLLPEADWLVQPSRTEGQGLAVLEAFRAGVPVVASDIPALRELVRDGDTGCLFRSDDAAALASALDRALTLPAGQRAGMISKARELLHRRYTRGAMFDAHEVLYAAVTLAAVG